MGNELSSVFSNGHLEAGNTEHQIDQIDEDCDECYMDSDEYYEDYDESCSYDSECEEIDTDALGADVTGDDLVNMSALLIINDGNITLETLFAIEEELHVDDKVALIYLLYKDAVVAYEDIQEMLFNPEGSYQPIYDWAVQKEKYNENWKKPVIEALAVIQAYRVLRMRFGYEKNVVNTTFLPYSKSVAVNLNKTRKVLYLIFDNLPAAKVREIFLKVQEHPGVQGIRFPRKTDDFYFERLLLYLEKISFITLDNVKNLASIFKKMGMDEAENELQQLIKDSEKKNVVSPFQNFEKEKKLLEVAKSAKPGARLEQDNADETSLTYQQQSLPSVSYVSLENSYTVKESSPGICLIINNKYFYTDIENKNLLPDSDKKLQERHGTEIDEKALKHLFKQLNFNEDSIIIMRNRRHDELVQDIRDAAGKVGEHSTFFVIILSHGEKDVVYGVNSCKVQISEIQAAMSTTNLACLEGKPKILILQCCQGSKCQTVEGDNDYMMDGTEQEDELPADSCLPKSVDNFTFLATVPGYGAIRHRTKGTWFIQTFCRTILKSGHREHFEELCTNTLREVSQKIWKTSGEKRCMVPLKWSTLTKKLYLPLKSSEDKCT